MKTAILLNGNSRTIDKCGDNILKTFNHLNPDYFVTTYDLKYGYHPAVKDYLKFYEDTILSEDEIHHIYSEINPKQILIDKDSDLHDYYNSELPKINPTLRHEASFLQYVKMRKGLDIIEKFESENDIKYDLIIKTRNDMIHNPLKIDLSVMGDNQVIVSDKNVFPNDCIIITKRDNFFKILETLISEFYNTKGSKSLTNPPHGLLEYSCTSNGFNIKIEPIMDHIVRVNKQHYYK